MGPSRAKSLEKDAKMKARGRFLEHFGLRLTASEGSEPPWGRFGCHPGSVNSILFLLIFQKSVICRIRCHSQAEVLLLQVQAPKLELLGPKSQSRAVQSCKSEGPGQSSLDGRFGLAGGVMRMAR